MNIKYFFFTRKDSMPCNRRDPAGNRPRSYPFLNKMLYIFLALSLLLGYIASTSGDK